MEYKKLADDTLLVRLRIPPVDYSDPEGSLSRIFNFSARQVVTLYERYHQTSGYNGNRAEAMTSSMQVHHFSELENPEEVTQMREKLISLRGNPPEIGKSELNKSRKHGGLL